MKVEMPEAVDVLGLEAADFALLEPCRGAPSAWRIGKAALLQESVGLHEAPQRGIGRQWPARRIRAHHRSEVVVMELIAPAPMRGVLLQQHLAERLADRGLPAGIRAPLAAQHADRIDRCAARVLIP